MYNPYSYNYQPQQNFMQPWTQQNQMQQPAQWQQPLPAPQPEPAPQPMMQQPSDIAQAIHRLCDILEAQRGGQNHA